MLLKVGIFSRPIYLVSTNAGDFQVDTGLGSVVKFLSTEGGSVNKETLSKRFPLLM